MTRSAADPRLRRPVVAVARTYGRLLGAVLSVGKRCGAGRLGGGPAATAGVLLSVHLLAVTMWFGPLGIGAALGAGLVSVAVVRRRVRHRGLTEVERRTAGEVFGTASWLDDVVLTDLAGRGRRAFTLPAVDGRILCNLGTAFDAPLGAGTGAYPAPAQLLIHELVHAWQITAATSPGEFLADALADQARYELGEDVYGMHDAGDTHRALRRGDVERQATVVDRWFAGQSSPTRRPRDPNSPYLHEIEQLRSPRRRR
ncbi:hypothetical protein GTC6_00100 [Gordonia terrae C-6]|uniref:DUF4157 domain-containing protein n=1 Tax=Gordonia terrae C-6 TaxID=1316928 RepID=R7YFN2_9ACTN|nr:hypothetical protein [Gordonia terrae]EON34609.1 hypothetical protein GTC6_00100 [Gordonia terrae C-6]